jgi:hypothetical protein
LLTQKLVMEINLKISYAERPEENIFCGKKGA